MSTTAVTIELEPDLAEGLARAAGERSTSVETLLVSAARRLLDEDVSGADRATEEEEASMRRALEDVRNGRLTDHDAVFARLDAKHGWR